MTRLSEKTIKELDKIEEMMEILNGVCFHWDDFYDPELKLGKFGETLKIGKFVFKKKSGVYTEFAKDTILSKAFNHRYNAFELCIYQLNKKYYPSEHAFEPTITTIESDDYITVVGYSIGSKM